MSNIPTNTPSPSAPGPAPAPGPGPHKEPADAEEVYYQGSPPVRGMSARLMLFPLAGLLLIAAPFFLHHWNVRLSPTDWIVCIVIGMCLPMVPVLWARTIRYRISNYRIDYERGLI